MCLSPILIKNQSRIYKGRILSNAPLYDTQSQFIYVPCGVCSECCKKKQMYIVQRTQLESLDNYIFFFTLTYQQSSLRSFELDGFTHYYADLEDIRNTFKRMRKSPFWRKFNDIDGSSTIKYLYVTEYGGKKHRPHYHGMIFVPKRKNDTIWTPLNYERKLFDLLKSEWTRNVGSTRSPIYEPLCKYIVRGNHRTFDLHYVNPSNTSRGDSDVGFYVTKYCLKFDDWIDRKRKALYINHLDHYKEFWNLLRPRIITSKHFGLSPSAKEYVRKCLDVWSKNSLYPVFRNPTDGRLFPMSPYLYNKFGTLKDKYNFFYKASNPDSDFDSFHYTNNDPTRDARFSEKTARNMKKICNTDVYDYIRDEP